jgi:homoserine acetyltransferase
MLALEWVLITAEEESANSSQHSQSGYRYVRSAVIIGCSARQGAWQIAHSELQRQAIYNDPHWDGGNFLTR